MFDKLLKYYCSSSFLICIVLGLIKIIHSQEHPSAVGLKTLKKHYNLWFGPIILHSGTNDINDNSDPQNIAEEIAELDKSISKNCNSNVTVSGIVPRYGKLNEKVRSVNRLLRIYCRNMDMRFVGHENINPSKHLNCSGLHLNHLGTPIFIVNFLNVLNSLIWNNDSNQ